MRGINYQAGLGTLLVFIGFYCLKAVFSKGHTVHGESKPASARNKKTGNLYLLLFGLIGILSGVLLILKEMKLF